MKSSKSFLTAIAATAATLGAPLFAHSQGAPVTIPLDGEQVVGDVSVGCTGVGQEKDNPRWKAYPIRVEAANPGGDLLANMAVSLSGKDGAVLATVKCEGPWIMLRPSPGTYRLEGWLPRQGLAHQIASITAPASGQKIVTLVFPQS
jgi:hypothetical protein